MSGTAGSAGPEFEALLQFLDSSRGFDFTGYKRASLERRVRRRMDKVDVASFTDYVDYLEVHPDEYEHLFNAILINVTEFFRDPDAWEHLRATSIPLLLADRAPDDPIRVWSAGCATGQEAYTIAMVLAEAVGLEAYRERVKIYATDIDEEALDVARAGSYGVREMETVPEDLRERYFERQDRRMTFRKDLRRTVIFGRNNLVADAPISRLDILLCRNTLMYMNSETQGRIVRNLHFALRDGGILMLGRSEMMGAHRDRFAIEDLKKRIFRKLPNAASLSGRGTTMIAAEVAYDDAANDSLVARAATFP
jgi:two-component system, chemotaxis family, CheB/CheR fusion protein